MKATVLLLAVIGSAAAFVANPNSRPTTELFGGGSGYATSLTGKKEKVAGIQNLLDKSQMVFAVPASSITVKNSEKLRRSLPEGTTVSVVKNTLMTRAVEGTDYACATSMLTGANMWVFIEEDIGGTIKAYNAFLKEAKLLETHQILGGIIEGTVYDAAGVDAIGKLPSKLELYAQIAGSIKAVPTKVARVIKAPNSKLARAIKLATMPDEE
ncbi:Ribosomal protein L10 [Fragilaria crotonensis]|nr:Ribosomal protein L10 [Fragilaria crotonensis]